VNKKNPLFIHGKNKHTREWKTNCESFLCEHSEKNRYLLNYVALSLLKGCVNEYTYLRASWLAAETDLFWMVG